MVDVREDILRPPHGTTPAAVKSNIKSEMSNENIHKKEGGSYYVVSANKASSTCLQDVRLGKTKTGLLNLRRPSEA